MLILVKLQVMKLINSQVIDDSELDETMKGWEKELTWQIEWDVRAQKELKALDHPIQKKILIYLRERTIDNPRFFGKALSHDKVGLWRYRVEDYRIICRIEDSRLTVFVLAVAHRKEIYK